MALKFESQQVIKSSLKFVSRIRPILKSESRILSLLKFESRFPGRPPPYRALPVVVVIRYATYNNGNKLHLSSLILVSHIFPLLK